MERHSRLRSLGAFLGGESIRVRLLLPLVLIGTLIGLAITAVVGVRLSAMLEDQFESEAAKMSNSLVHIAQTGLSQEHMQRLLTATASARNIKLTLIATSSPLRMQASSRSAWIGKDVTEITDARITLIRAPRNAGSALGTTIQPVRKIALAASSTALRSSPYTALRCCDVVLSRHRI